jgi:predicted O-linked N-acetylglucosamine transferase (SPINDLY family)
MKNLAEANHMNNLAQANQMTNQAAADLMTNLAEANQFKNQTNQFKNQSKKRRRNLGQASNHLIHSHQFHLHLHRVAKIRKKADQEIANKVEAPQRVQTSQDPGPGPNQKTQRARLIRNIVEVEVNLISLRYIKEMELEMQL